MGELTSEQLEELIASVVTWIGAHSSERWFRQQRMCSLITRYGVRALRMAREAQQHQTVPGLVQYNAVVAERASLARAVRTLTAERDRMAARLRDADALIEWQANPTCSGEDYLDELRSYREKYATPKEPKP